MGILRRLGHILFGVMGICLLLALGMTQFGPYTHEATALLEKDWYRGTVIVLLGLVGLAFLFMLLKGLFARRRPKTVTVTRVGQDKITVTTNAISSQVTHIVESGGRNRAERVKVRVSPRGKAEIRLNVRPAYATDLTEEGVRLHEALVSGLMKLCGDSVKSIAIQFVEPESPVDALALADEEGYALDEYEEAPYGDELAEAPYEPAGQDELPGAEGDAHPGLASSVSGGDEGKDYSGLDVFVESEAHDGADVQAAPANEITVPVGKLVTPEEEAQSVPDAEDEEA